MKWLIGLCLCARLCAATYYVDYVGGSDSSAGTSKGSAWQRVKGMVGCTGTCSSTTLASGDIVIFKGGVTWPSGVYVWELVGGTSSAVAYTTDHTWYAGASWSQPSFDPGGADVAGGEIRSDSSNYITLNDLNITNCGAQPGTVSSHYCVTFYNGSNISVTNCTFRPNDWISTFFEYTASGTYSNLTYSGNDVSGTSNAVWIGTTQPNIAIHGVSINGNTFHDYHSNLVGGTHGNGLNAYRSPGSDTTQYIDGVTFCGNRAYGDFTSNGTYVSGVSGGGMTAFFFAETSLSGTVCNNDFSFTPVQASMFNSLIYISVGASAGHNTIGVYNNSLVNAGVNAMSAGIDLLGLSTGDSVSIENNIGSGMQNCIYAQDSGSAAALTTVDYNLWNSCNQQKLVSTYYSYAQWQGLGYDVHGVLGSSPLWVSAPGNETLQSGSPAINAGTNLTNLGIAALNSDITGQARAAIGPWTIGAYNGQIYGGVSTSGGVAKSNVTQQ